MIQPFTPSSAIFRRASDGRHEDSDGFAWIFNGFSLMFIHFEAKNMVKPAADSAHL